MVLSDMIVLFVYWWIILLLVRKGERKRGESVTSNSFGGRMVIDVDYDYDHRHKPVSMGLYTTSGCDEGFQDHKDSSV